MNPTKLRIRLNKYLKRGIIKITNPLADTENYENDLESSDDDHL